MAKHVKSNGKIEYRFKVTVDGKKRTVTGKTEAEAKAKKQKLLELEKKKIDINWQNATVTQLIDAYTNYHKDEEWSMPTYNWFVDMGKHVKNQIGSMKISDVKLTDLDNVVRTLKYNNPKTNKPSSKALLMGVKKVIRLSFAWAEANRYIEHNPAKAMSLPKPVKKTDKEKDKNNVKSKDDKERQGKRTLTPEEISWIIYTPHELQTANMIMLYIGCRSEELLALKWSDIDTDNGIININKTIQYDKNKPILVDDVKNYKPRKAVMPPELKEYLTEAKKNKEPNDLIVSTKKGGYFTKSGWRHKYQSYITDLDILYGGKYNSKHSPYYQQTIKGWTPYSLRHTSATLGGAFGVDKKQLADNQGHDEDTMKRYYENEIIEIRRKELEKISYKDKLSKPEIITPESA